MSRVKSLDKRVINMAGTIYLWDCPKNELIAKILQFFSTSSDILHYYFIYHDDEDKLHFHYIIRLNSSIRCSTMLNNLERELDINRNQIGIEPLTDLNAYLRYFIHLEYDDKKQYLITQIYSDEPQNIIEGYINQDNYEMTTERLIMFVVNCSTLDDLMVRMGLKSYHKYRYEISQLWDIRGGLIIRYKHLINNDINDLPF